VSRRFRGALALSLTLLLAPPSVALADCRSTPECLALLDEARKDLRTLEADFTQVKRLSLLNEPIESSGRFVFKGPDRLLLQVDRPAPTRILIRGGEIDIRGLPESERRALQGSPLAGTFASIGALFTGSLRQLEESFALQARRSGDGIEVELRPRQDRGTHVLRSMRLRFGGRNLLIEEIHIEESLGDSLTITLDNVRRNTGVSDTLFQSGEEP
jgi:outer membrane lipoprotein carrier protein